MPPREPSYDADGNVLSDGTFTYSWDANNRLIAVYSNTACVVSNAYDHQSRRIQKITPTATHTYFYDGWNLIQETIENQQSAITNRYIWGKDFSGTLQGAGGVGGLLAACLDGTYYFPLYDNNGNITAYLDSTGTTVATYTYDAFGRTINKSGTHATTFLHRFSTKCYDPETGLYYYGYRFYSPDLMRWLNRDPIEEKGGLNFYCIVGNQSVNIFDALGLRIQTEYVISPQIIQVTQGVVGGETEVVKADIYTKVNTSCANGCKGETWLLDAVIRVTYFVGTHHPQYVDVARHEGIHVSIWLSALMAIENALLDGTCAKEDCHTAKIN